MKFPKWLEVCGDIGFRGKCPTEQMEQVTLFNKIRKELPHIGAVALHIRNEGKRTHQQTAMQQMEGMVSGAADIIIPGAPCLVIELKRKDHTKCIWQKGQLEYLESAKNNGAKVAVCLGYEAAFIFIKKNYLT